MIHRLLFARLQNRPCDQDIIGMVYISMSLSLSLIHSHSLLFENSLEDKKNNSSGSPCRALTIAATTSGMKSVACE